MHPRTPGIGKTTACYERLGSQPYTPKITEAGAIWFDGYAGEEILLLDDFRGQIPIHEFNAICDRFPYRAPVKEALSPPGGSSLSSTLT